MAQVVATCLASADKFKYQCYPKQKLLNLYSLEKYSE
jgi:hypothetical protein